MGVFVLFSLFLLFIFIGVPISFALGASSIIYLVFSNPDFIGMLPQRIWSGTNSYIMIALPLFILAGELMNAGGITKRIVNFCLYLIKPIKGGLGEVNVIASMIFGGISGSSVADTSAIGSLLIPQMVEKGYSKEFSTGVTVASSTMGMIIPPSIPMLMYCMISGVSVAGLFLAGVIPGLLIGIFQLILSYTISKKKNYYVDAEKFKISDFFNTARDSILAVLMPLTIVISISFGIATATESAGVAVLYALLLGFFVYKQLKLKRLPQILLRTVMSSSAVMLVIGFSMIFSWILAMEQFSVKVADFFIGMDVGRVWILLMLDLLILFIGMFLDVSPALLLVTPVFIPVMQALNVDLLHFGAIMIIGLAMGLVTPPLGMCLNAANKICRMPIMNIFWSAAPFLLCNLIVLLLVTFVPALSLWLPGLITK